MTDESVPTTPDAEFTELTVRILELATQAVEEGKKGYFDGNKASARRARIAANTLKKLLTPLRQKIQDKVKPPKPKA